MHIHVFTVHSQMMAKDNFRYRLTADIEILKVKIFLVINFRMGIVYKMLFGRVLNKTAH